MLISPKQLKIIHTLLSKHRLTFRKADIVSGFTDGRTESTKAMSAKEATEMIQYLFSLDPEDKKAAKMRHKIIGLAHEMNWKKSNGKIDMDHINDWCVKLSYLHKKLDDYSASELPKLVTQFENGPYRHYISTLK